MAGPSRLRRIRIRAHHQSRFRFACRNSVSRAGSALNLSHAARNRFMHSFRSLPVPCLSTSRMGSRYRCPIFGSAAPVLNSDRAYLELETIVLEQDS